MTVFTADRRGGGGHHHKHHRRVPAIVPASGRGRVELPWAPNGATLDGHPPNWTTVARTERSPLLLNAGGGLRTWSGVIPIGHLDWQESVQGHVDRLLAIAAAGDTVTFVYGPAERGRWRITGCPVTVIQRTPRWDISFATVALTLTEVSDLTAHAGPVTGGHGPGGKTGGRPYPGAPRHYTTRAGDTLWHVAAKVYGKAEAWPIIADANHLRDGRSTKLKAGRKLTIP